ncbi:MAG: HIT family hydrolase, partial [Pseudonocardiaceae bacterium]
MTGPQAAGLKTAELVAQDGVGAPDGLQRLWTPHRMAYIKGEGKTRNETGVG